MHIINENEIIGAVKINSAWKFYAGTTGEWIMDYRSYDPSYKPEDWQNKFRNNVLVVNSNNADDFCQAMAERELTIENLRKMKSDGEHFNLSILIDFDSKTYVNGYYDLLLEEYVPKNWIGVSDSPLKYAPDHIKQIFGYLSE